MSLVEIFKELFTYLNSIQYQWMPTSPELTLRLRKSKSSFSYLHQYLGLGLPVHFNDLSQEGFPENLYNEIYPLSLAMSKNNQFFIPHHHWPAQPKNATHYVYFGQESITLAQEIQNHLNSFLDQKILDLGSGSGALTFEVANVAKKVLGLDPCPIAIQWARAATTAQGLKNVSFEQAAVGTQKAENDASVCKWDIALFNPPLAVPHPHLQTPHRDGGSLGIQIPLLFLDFAKRHLRPCGEVFCLISNPIVKGRPLFFDSLDSHVWKILDRRRFHEQFNCALYRKEQYHEQGIDRIELYFLHLQKRF